MKSMIISKQEIRNKQKIKKDGIKAVHDYELSTSYQREIHFMFSLKKSDTYSHAYLRSKQRTRQIIKNSCIYGWVTFCECLEEMLISDEGCKHLSYFPISYLTKLFLCRVFDKIDSNKISNGGCWHLSRGQWPQLQNINLSINNLIQISI